MAGLGFIQKYGNKIPLARGNSVCSFGCDAADGGGRDWHGDCHSLFGCVAFAVVADFSGPGQKTAPPTKKHLSCKKAKTKHLMLALPGDRERSSLEAENWLCQKAELLLGGGTRLSGSLAKCLRELVTWHCLAITRTPSATSRPQAQPERGAALQSKAAN